MQDPRLGVRRQVLGDLLASSELYDELLQGIIASPAAHDGKTVLTEERLATVLFLARVDDGGHEKPLRRGESSSRPSDIREPALRREAASREKALAAPFAFSAELSARFGRPRFLLLAMVKAGESLEIKKQGPSALQRLNRGETQLSSDLPRANHGVGSPCSLSRGAKLVPVP